VARLRARVRSPVPGDAQLPVQRLQPHVFQSHSRKLDLEDDFLGGLKDVGRRRPKRRLDPLFRELGAVHRLLEKAVDLLLDREEVLQ
jgi:hypothetical protein